MSEPNEIGDAVVVSVDGDLVAVDASNLVGGLLVSFKWLIEEIAIARGMEPELVVAELREFWHAA